MRCALRLTNISYTDWKQVEEDLDKHYIPISMLDQITQIETESGKFLFDAVSKGQLISKIWLLNNIADIDLSCTVVCGGWIGILSRLILEKYDNASVMSIDIDQFATKTAQQLNTRFYYDRRFDARIVDMYKHKYDMHTTIINTSCEHIPDITQWISLLPKNRNIVIQSNNNDKLDGHINCANSIAHFINQSGLNENNIKYAGSLETPMYTRFMIIAKT